MLPTFALITPARNEAKFIELTLTSVVAQTARPLKWVVVSDGSTDGTDEIVRSYAATHPWIELVRMPERRERHFSGKVQAFNAGYARVADLDPEVIGSLDADISFDEEYFSFLLGKLVEDSGLGVVGTPFQEGTSPIYDYRFVNIEHVSGACQLFRRACFEQIGGYVPVASGGIDYIAVTTARMKGWKTRTFTEKVCLHHRDIGTAQNHWLTAKFRYGVKDHALGNHPLWEMFRVVHQMTKRPMLAGGLALGSGYAWALIRDKDRPVSRELVAFTRHEQMSRLKRFLAGHSTSSVVDEPATASVDEVSATAREIETTTGSLIINADDWGKDELTTDRISECLSCGAVSSVSAMVFMEDSERAAAIASESAIDAGLHLNLTTPFTAENCPPEVRKRQSELAAFLLTNRLARMVFHPRLARAFRYVVEAQVEEFSRIYGREVTRIDGHHHQHLCANVLFGNLLPRGTIVRRNFYFEAGEKSLVNRLYRRGIDQALARGHEVVDYFVQLPPMEPVRLRGVFSLAKHSVVEVETHPANAEELRFLLNGGIARYCDQVAIAKGFFLPGRQSTNEPRVSPLGATTTSRAAR